MSNGNSTMKKMLLGLVVLALLSPVGVILPDMFKAGSAWGEWGPDEIGKMVGYVPQGMKNLADLWQAPMPDYSFKGWEEKGAQNAEPGLRNFSSCGHGHYRRDCPALWKNRASEGIDDP